MVSQNILFTVTLFHHLDDCVKDNVDTQKQVAPSRSTIRHDKTRSSFLNEGWTCVFKHRCFKTTDFKPLKHKQQSYMRAPSLFLCERSKLFFADLLALNDYINTLACVRIAVFASVFASILINTVI